MFFYTNDIPFFPQKEYHKHTFSKDPQRERYFKRSIGDIEKQNKKKIKV